MRALMVKPRGIFPSLHPVPDGKGSWITAGALAFWSERLNDVIVVPTGSHNNLASIPRPARLLFPVNGPHRIAAIVHDYLYGVAGVLYDGRTVSREMADAIFYDLMRMPRVTFLKWLSMPARMSLSRLEGPFRSLSKPGPLVSLPTATSMHLAVRVGGWASWP